MIATHAVIAFELVVKLVDINLVEIGSNAVSFQYTMMRIYKADPLNTVSNFSDGFVGCRFSWWRCCG